MVMATTNGVNRWEPVQGSERYTTLDLLRGFALFGVLLVNLLYFFRISLFEHFLRFHSDAGWANHAVDLLVAVLVEFKAFDLFSLTFGMGVAIQTERAAVRGIRVEMFLARRFLILLAFGLLHMLLISNVDILSLYAVCGILLIPLLRVPTAILAVLAFAAVYLPSVLSAGLPPASSWQAHAVAATRIYGHGGFGDILMFRWRETQQLILPLLVGSAQKTFGLMLLGLGVWRSGIFQAPQRRRLLLWTVCIAGGLIGAINTAADVSSEVALRPLALPPWFQALGSHVPLAFAYAAGLLIWRPADRSVKWTAPIAATGQMALTNYLAQSIIFAVLFYGYGFGLFGRLATAPGAAVGVAIYAGQLAFSKWWLNHHRFGPFEWLWRSITYGRRQPMRLPQLSPGAIPG